MSSTAAATIALSVSKKLFTDLYESSKSGVKRKLKIISTDSRIKDIRKSISSVQKVKTMWRIDKETKLLTFYYPSKLVIDSAIRTINSLSDVSVTERFVIQGTVGQGKSIFLRYLCIQELMKGQRIPVFVELRRYQRQTLFQEFIINAIALYGIPCDEAVFDYLARSGKMVLLLDAFDEVDPDAVTGVLQEVELLAQRFPALQIVITSRPVSGIEQSPHFRVYQLAPLRPEDHKPFLEKIIEEKNKGRVAEILQAINSGNEIRSLLQTPLLMTLLVIVHSATQSVPSSLPEFYEELFHTLLTRHDKTKPGFRRKRATGLGDSDLRKLFEAFCFVARQKNQLVLKEVALSGLVDSACSLTGISCTSDAFSNDITKVACLMQQEGFEYHFIHKSVVEFHAACFVSHGGELIAQKFYSSMENKWAKWAQELEFLSQIDKVRYSKYFLIPSALRSFEIIGVVEDGGDLTDAGVEKIFNLFSIGIQKEKDTGLRHYYFQSAMNVDFMFERIAMQSLNKVLQSSVWREQIVPAATDAGYSGPSAGEPFGAWLIRNGHMDVSKRSAAEALKSARKACGDARRILELESKVADFMIT